MKFKQRGREEQAEQDGTAVRSTSFFFQYALLRFALLCSDLLRNDLFIIHFLQSFKIICFSSKQKKTKKKSWLQQTKEKNAINIRFCYRSLRPLLLTFNLLLSSDSEITTRKFLPNSTFLKWKIIQEPLHVELIHLSITFN